MFKFITVCNFLQTHLSLLEELHDLNIAFFISVTITPKITINWDDMGINVNGENLNHLRFADDIEF